MKKILVIDDHCLFAEGIELLLQHAQEPLEILYAPCANTGLKASQDRTDVDLILLDLNLPDINGLSFIKELQKEGIWTPILMISASESLQNARCAITQGALGYICKSASSDELIEAIDIVLRGEIYLPQGWDRMINQVAPVDVAAHEEGGRITPRKLEILHLVAHGYPNKLIAKKLALSEHTIKVHLRELFRALGVSNRTTCIRVAKRLGLIQA